jgi:hypothetical protein
VTEPLGSETLRYRVEAGDDGFGNPVAAGDPVTWEGCAFYPRGASTEATGREMTVIDGYTALVPERVTIDANGEIEWAEEPGTWRKIVGKAGVWKHLDGTFAGTQINVRGESG